MQVPHSSTRGGGAPQPSPRIASLLALAVLLGCALVVWAHHVGRHRVGEPTLASTTPSRITLEHVDRFKAEVHALQGEIEAVTANLAAVDRTSYMTRPEGLLIRARSETRTALDLIAKMEVAVQGGRGFVARHLLGEWNRELHAARTNLEQARRGLPGQ